MFKEKSESLLYLRAHEAVYQDAFFKTVLVPQKSKKGPQPTYLRFVVC